MRTIQGDTFESVSYRYWGTTAHAEALMNANRDKIETQIFEAGVELAEPTVEAATTALLPPWMRS